MIVKKALCLILSVLMLCSLAACGANKQSDEDFVWTRQGYFSDADENILYVFPSEDKDHPGWAVGCFLGEEAHGWFIQQEGRTLYGNLTAEYLDEDAFIVTVSEEGEDGLLLEVEGGKTYHFVPKDMPEFAFAATVNTEGNGQIAYAEEGEEPEFDDEFPAQSAYLGLEGPKTYVFAAKPDEGWKFVKWTRNGEEYSRDPQITVEITEDSAFIAVFYIAGTDETPVDLDAVKTVGELLGLPQYGYSASEGRYVFAFEQDEIFYRAIAAMPEDVADAVFALDFDDPQHDEKLNALIAPLEVVRIDNLNDTILTQEQLDALVGKTGEELFNEGWTNSGWNLQDMEFYMSYGAFDYLVTFEGSVDNYEDCEEEDINPLIVKSAVYYGRGDLTNTDDLDAQD